MRALVIAATIASLAAPAYAQQGLSTTKSTAPKEDPLVEAQRKRDRDEIDKSYNAAIGRNPEQSKKIDPWGDVRAAEQPAKGQKR